MGSFRPHERPRAHYFTAEFTGPLRAPLPRLLRQHSLPVGNHWRPGADRRRRRDGFEQKRVEEQKQGSTSAAL